MPPHPDPLDLPLPDAPPEPAPTDPAPTALRTRLAGRVPRVLLWIALLGGAAYLVDHLAGLHRLPPLRPFAALLGLEDDGPPPVSAEAIARETDVLEDALAARLAGPDPASVLAPGEPRGGPAAGKPAAGRPAAAAAGTAAAAPRRPAVAPADSVVQPIEEPCRDGEAAAPCDARALDRFYAALRRTALHEAGAVTRISHFGDSIIIEDLFTSAIRRRLQQRFGDAGHGFLFVAKPWDWYGHSGVKIDYTTPWHVRRVTTQPAHDDRYGFGGVSCTAGGPGAKATFSTVDEGPVGRTLSRFEVHALAQPGGGRFEITVDGKRVREVSLQAAEPTPVFPQVEVPDGPHAFGLRTLGGGTVRLFGVVLEREGPGVVYDGIGLLGASARALLVPDPDDMRLHFAHRDPDLVVLQFGTNESDHDLTEALYRDKLEQVVARIRSVAPQADCLLVSPPDRADPATHRTRGLIPIIVRVQSEVARRAGCGFWNTFEAMGGENSIWKWYRMNPRRAFGDLTHLAPEGGEVLGALFEAALLAGFVDYLDRTESAGTP